MTELMRRLCRLTCTTAAALALTAVGCATTGTCDDFSRGAGPCGTGSCGAGPCEGGCSPGLLDGMAGNCGTVGCDLCNAGVCDGGCGLHGGHLDGVRTKWDCLKRSAAAFDTRQLYGDNCWPDQYDRESARRVYAPFAQQLRNGNAVETTVWAHYFEDPDEGEDRTAELTAAGKARLQYLARKRPYIIPNLRLQTSFDPALDQARVQSVLGYVEEVSFQPVPWRVDVVNAAPVGMIGSQAPKMLQKAFGPPVGPSIYEPALKGSFLQQPQQGGGF